MNDSERYWHSHVLEGFDRAKAIVAYRQRWAAASVHDFKTRAWCRRMIWILKRQVIELAERLEQVMRSRNA
jgi:hypothetical protein